MEIHDGHLIDFLRDELDPVTRRIVEEALEADPSLRKRFDQVVRTLTLSKTLPGLKPSQTLDQKLSGRLDSLKQSTASPSFGALIDNLAGELDDTQRARLHELLLQEPYLQERHDDLQLLLTQLEALSLSPTPELKKKISERLRLITADQSESQTLDAESSELVDFMHGELDQTREQEVSKRLHEDQGFARKGRLLERLQRLLGHLEINPSRDLKLQVREALERAEADVLIEPPPAERELIDFLRHELSDLEHEEMVERLAADAALNVKLTRIEAALNTAYSLPKITPSSKLRSDMQTRLASLKEEQEALQWQQRLGSAVDMLRGELHPEHAEAALEAQSDVAFEASRILSTTGSLPALEPSSQLQKRIATAIAKESAAAEKKTSSKPENAKPFLSLPEKHAAPHSLRLPQHKISKDLLRGGATILTLFRSRQLIAACLVHAIALFTAYFVIIEDAQDVHGLGLKLAHYGAVDLMPGDYTTAGPLEGDHAFENDPAGVVVEDSFVLGPFGERAPARTEASPPPDQAVLRDHQLIYREHRPESHHANTHEMLRGPTQSFDQEGWFSNRFVARRIKYRFVKDLAAEDIDLLAKLDEILNYLSDAQHADGSWLWNADGQERAAIKNGSVSESDDEREMRRMENTGLALLALLGDGHTPERGLFADNVKRGIDFLLERQHESGAFVTLKKAGSKIWFDWPHADAICTFALAEAYALTKDASIRQGMKLGLERLLATQITEGSAFQIGGFPYSLPRQRNVSPRADIMTTAWVAQALRAAQAAGWKHASLAQAREAIDQYLMKNSSTGEEFGVYSSPWQFGAMPGTAAAMVPQMLSTAPEMFEDTLRYQTEFLSQPHYLPSHGVEPAGNGFAHIRTNYLSWHFASLAMLQDGVQSEAERVYLTTLYETLFRGSNYSKGSFSPHGDEEHLHGRVYTAALGALCIENAYRINFDRTSP